MLAEINATAINTITAVKIADTAMITPRIY